MTPMSAAKQARIAVFRCQRVPMKEGIFVCFRYVNSCETSVVYSSTVTSHDATAGTLSVMRYYYIFSTKNIMYAHNLTVAQTA